MTTMQCTTDALYLCFMFKADNKGIMDQKLEADQMLPMQLEISAFAQWDREMVPRVIHKNKNCTHVISRCFGDKRWRKQERTCNQYIKNNKIMTCNVFFQHSHLWSGFFTTWNMIGCKPMSEERNAMTASWTSRERVVKKQLQLPTRPLRSLACTRLHFEEKEYT